MWRTRWMVVVALSCIGTVGTTAYAKFATEIYPSVMFPSFGQVLELDDIPPGAGTNVVLYHGDETLTVSSGDWFDGPPSSALDRLSEKLVELSSDDSAWIFERADQLAGTCVERISITVASSAEPVSNQFERRCA